MTSIDIQFPVRRRLAHALCRREFDEAVEMVGSPEDEQLAFHAPPGVAVAVIDFPISYPTEKLVEYIEVRLDISRAKHVDAQARG